MTTPAISELERLLKGEPGQVPQEQDAQYWADKTARVNAMDQPPMMAQTQPMATQEPDQANAMADWASSPEQGGLGIAGPGAPAQQAPLSMRDTLLQQLGLPPPSTYDERIASQQAMPSLMHQAAANRASLANHLATREEQSRQHDLGLIEKAMANPRGPAMLEALAKDPNFKLARQAGMLSKALKDTDYSSFEAYREFIPQDVQDRFIKGNLPYPELVAWTDQARESTKVNAKEAAKAALVKQALNTPTAQQTPYQTQLVEEHQAKTDLQRADIDLKKAQTKKALSEAEHPANKNGLGHDREAFTQQLFGPGATYSTLSQPQMEAVNDKVAKFQGDLALKRATSQQTAQLNVPDKPSATERQAMIDDAATIERVDDLTHAYKSAFVGPLSGRFGSMLETVGGIGENEADFRAEVSTLKNQVIKQITGAQMSEPEAKRIMRQIPDANNPPAVFEARLRLTRKNITMMAKKRREVLQQSGIDVSHVAPIKESAEPQGMDPSKVQGAIDEVFK